jgi:glycosyltransferase involved in cell wall biosynthesis
MKIALLSFEYPPETGFGGIGTYTWYHARALVRLGHEVHVIAGLNRGAGPAPAIREPSGVFVHRFRAEGRIMRRFQSFGRRGYHWTQQRFENGWSMYGALNTLHARHKFDIAEMPECGAEGWRINARLPLPTIVRFHSPSRLIMPFYDVPKADIAMCSALEDRAIRHASALTACSQFLADEAQSKLGVDAPIQVIPNGLDLDLFDNAPIVDVADRYGLPKDKVTILFTGRMERRKGSHLFAAIARSVLSTHNAAFVFAGEDLFGHMKQLLAEMPSFGTRGSVHYVGKLPLDELRSFIRVADIMMLPSLWENCPYSCLEAMSAARAIVASDQGGFPELIRHGHNGFLATTGQPESFAANLKTLIDDESLRLQIGNAARRTVEDRYTDSYVARRSVEVYANCIERSARLGRYRGRHATNR